MNLKRFQKLLHDAIRKEKEENGVDVRGYEVEVQVDFGSSCELEIGINHPEKMVIIRD